jgi:hypothetical protein
MKTTSLTMLRVIEPAAVDREEDIDVIQWPDLYMSVKRAT